VSPWETRERGDFYYTRSKRKNGKVVREYIGGGILGELAARMDAEERERREREAASWREEKRNLEALVAPLEELHHAVEVLVRAALIASGYHRHNRGEWRKRRDRTQQQREE